MPRITRSYLSHLLQQPEGTAAVPTVVLLLDVFLQELLLDHSKQTKGIYLITVSRLRAYT
jgi:hypothetical protein